MPLPEPDATRIHHLRAAATKAIEFAAGHQADSLQHDEVLRLALAKLVEIVGEAANQVSNPTRAAYPSVPWTAAARMRDRLVHDYFDIDLDVLWATIHEDLPTLLTALPPPEPI